MRLTFEKLWQRSAVLAALVLLAALLLIPGASVIHSQAPPPGKPVPRDFKGGGGPSLSGAFEFRDVNFGTGITECPQAGLSRGGEGDDNRGWGDNRDRDGRPRPLDRREKDEVEQLSNQGDDQRVNQDFSCFPQNEVSVDTNPRTSRNFVVGMNDYRFGTGSSGFSATTDGGQSFYDGIIPFPSGPGSQTRGEGFVPSSGDPIIFYDSDGVVYYGHIGFFRGSDTNGVFVSRSTNGGFTWTRACIPAGVPLVCGGLGDPRQPGDGVVTFNPDPDNIANGNVPSDDKPYATAGPRPSGVAAVCFNPISRTPTACNQAVVGADRLYVTFTRFTAAASQILLSYSDDQGRSWSPSRPINGSASFCAFAAVPEACDDNQFSVPTVSPETGFLYVAFENFNTPDENQYLVVRSHDGGQTFQGPFHVTPVFDLNFPRAGVQRPDCTPRGAQTTRIVYTNSCFRSNPAGNIVADKRGGAFADDLYLVMSDNRNGTTASSNADVFLFKSIDGGSTWIGPTRVNSDRSSLGSVSRDCRRPPGSIGFSGPTDPACAGDFGNDQWWPWVDIGQRGELNIVMKDRRLDINSVDHEWAPAGRQRPGNYLVWTWGAQCLVSRANSRECLAPGAAVIPQPTAPVDPGPDPVPGQGNQFVGSFRNFKVTDVPSNYDYSFRAGIFAGDYENVAVFDSGTDDDAHHFGKHGDDGDHGNGGAKAVAVFTDARNGRSSRNQTGRNPICEQSDVFFDIFDAVNARSGGGSTVNITPFLVTACPADAIEPQGHHDEEDR